MDGIADDAPVRAWRPVERHQAVDLRPKVLRSLDHLIRRVTTDDPIVRA